MNNQPAGHEHEPTCVLQGHNHETQGYDLCPPPCVNQEGQEPFAEFVSLQLVHESSENEIHETGQAHNSRSSPRTRGTDTNVAEFV